MLSKPLAVALLAVACVTAAAGGAYVAVRQNAAAPAALDRPAASPTAPSSSPAVPETEAAVTPAVKSTPETEPAPALERSDRALDGTSRTPERRERLTSPARTEPSRERPRPPVATERPASARTETARRTDTPAPISAASMPEPAAPARTDALPPVEPVTEPVRSEPPAPPPPAIEELVIPSASVIGLQIETPISSERARVEDRIEARVMRDVTINGRTALPAGARAVGAVTLVERGGKIKERARLGVRFHTLVLADGTELPMRTETIVREGESPSGESARKIGGAAVGGAILGAIIGGKKGALVGGATGAAGGSAVVMAGDRNAATFPAGAVVTVRLAAPVTVAVERE